jgi:hypothetical protein
VYDFLDPHKEHGKLAVYIVGIAVAECIVFAIVHGICVGREKVFGKRREKRQGLNEWEQVGMTQI